MTEIQLTGSRGSIVLRRWPNDDARYAAVLVHGYGEHAGRYDHVAAHLVAHGATVAAADHAGHGRSDGERALVEDVADLVSDLDRVVELMRARHPGLPVILVGHSMGGLVATRYAQDHAAKLAALVLSGPAVAMNPQFAPLLELDSIPDVPIDPAILSRDAAVGRAYADDELVYHGPFQRPTLVALAAAIEAVAGGPALDGLPVLWIHGELDALAPLSVTRPVVERLGGTALRATVYPGAMHEVFNETNRDEVLAGVTRFVDDVLRRA
jgi:alpha-beta hydrolase superfamily lysophospholipase